MYVGISELILGCMVGTKRKEPHCKPAFTTSYYLLVFMIHCHLGMGGTGRGCPTPPMVQLFLEGADTARRTALFIYKLTNPESSHSAPSLSGSYIPGQYCVTTPRPGTRQLKTAPWPLSLLQLLKLHNLNPALPCLASSFHKNHNKASSPAFSSLSPPPDACWCFSWGPSMLCHASCF